MDLKPDGRIRESAMIATLTVLTLLLLPLLVVAGTVLYVASVVRLNVIVFGECGRALGAWASRAGDAA
jgi:hypothetical protein